MRFSVHCIAALGLSVLGAPVLATTTDESQQSLDNSAFTPPPVFEIEELRQSFDLGSNYVKKSSFISIKNIDTNPQEEFFLGVSESDYQHLALVEGKVDGPNGQLLRVDPPVYSDDSKGIHYYRVRFPEVIQPGESLSFLLAQALINEFEPVPEFARQSDHQLLVFEASKYPPSPYPIRSATVRVKVVGSAFDEDISPDAAEDTYVKDGNLLTWGPYNDIEPFSKRLLKFRFERPNSLIAITKLVRDIWVSHSGDSVSFDESYWLKNIGTKIKGEFSRLDYQGIHKGYDLNTAALRSLLYRLPLGAREVYYTDLVGNVSTSKFHPSRSDSALEVKPRYPLFGGWNYNYTIGWSVDLGRYSKLLEKDTYILRLPFIDGPEDISYQDVTVRVILPQGAENVEVLPPAGGKSVNHTVTYSYLDSKGRPTVELKYDRLVDSYKAGYIYVTYSYTLLESLRKPLTLSATFFAVFMLYLAISKVDLEIVKPKSSKSTKT